MRRSTLAPNVTAGHVTSGPGGPREVGAGAKAAAHGTGPVPWCVFSRGDPRNRWLSFLLLRRQKLEHKRQTQKRPRSLSLNEDMDPTIVFRDQETMPDDTKESQTWSKRVNILRGSQDHFGPQE